MKFESDQIKTTESGLYVVDTSTSLTSQGNIRILESGLAVAMAPSTLEVPDQIALPKGLSRILPGQIVLSKSSAAQSTVIVPNATELMEVVKPTAEKPTRNSADLAVALTKTKIFLSREIDSHFASKIPADVKEVLTVLASDSDQKCNPQESHTARRKEAVQYWDKTTEKTKTVTKTSPGPLETVAIIAVDMLDDANLRAHSKQVVFEPVNELLQKYRRPETGNRLQLPEMPDLSIKLIDSIDYFATNPTLRFNIYALLEQIQLPDSIRESLMAKMDKHKDLDHPLAFETTIGLAQSKPESGWIQLQQTRRQQLLDQLSGSAQAVFGHFDELKKLSQGLVVSTNLITPRSGKVGMEIETRFNKQSQANHISSFIYAPIEGLPENEWRVHPDGSNDEITRADNNLMFGLDYSRSIIDLAKWTRDHTDHLVSLHLHFDRTLHPSSPDLKRLYEDSQQTVKKNALGTWEIRFLNLPKGFGTFHPGRITDAVNLFLAATEPLADDASLNPKIEATDNLYGLPELIFGHLTQIISSPDGRLAALMALHDETILKSLNPLAFANTYSEQSLATVSKSLQGVFKSGTDMEMLNTLQLCADLGLDQAKNSILVKTLSLACSVLGIVPTPQPIDQHWQHSWLREPQPQDDHTHIRTTLPPHIQNWGINPYFATPQEPSGRDQTDHLSAYYLGALRNMQLGLSRDRTPTADPTAEQSNDYETEITRISRLLESGLSPDQILQSRRRPGVSLTDLFRQQDHPSPEPLISMTPDSHNSTLERISSRSRLMQDLLNYSPQRTLSRYLESSILEHHHEEFQSIIPQILENRAHTVITIAEQLPEISRIRQTSEPLNLRQTLININHELNHINHSVLINSI